MPQYRFERLRDEYAQLWAAMHVVKGVEAARQARKVISGKDRYKAVEATTGVPWFVIGCLHMRESNGDFSRWLHNGDKMERGGVRVRTVNVPANRPPDPSITWEEGAYDALVTVQHFDEIKAWGPERVAYTCEAFNGWGYRSPARDIPSPYLWGGTSVQKPGKFVADHKYDPTVMDPQIGAMAVLRMVMEIDPEAHFSAIAEVPPPPITEVDRADAEPESPASPKAQDTETGIKPLARSNTIWGGLGLWATSAFAAIKGLFESLHDPFALVGFLGLLAAGSLGLWFVVTGRLNVQKLVAHLSQDDTGTQ